VIELTPLQRDALIEICNIGMSKSAKQLSSLLNTRIAITIPEINLFDINKIYSDNLFPPDKTLSYVYQIISGDLSGRAILIFQRNHTTLLTQSVIGESPKLSEKEVRACEQEAMLEIGNIIISSCMSAIVNMLLCKVQLSIPKYYEDNMDHLVKSQLSEIDNSSADIILLETRLETSGQDISGKLMLMLTIESINYLFLKLAELLNAK
jgi:chemotaxis protein CheC